MGKNFVSIQEAARITGLSGYYIRTRARAGSIPVIRCGSKFRVDLEALLDQLHKEASANV